MARKSKAPAERFGLPSPPSDGMDDGPEPSESGEPSHVDEDITPKSPLLPHDPPVDFDPPRGFSSLPSVPIVRDRPAIVRVDPPPDAVWIKGKARIRGGRNRGGFYWPESEVVRPLSPAAAAEVEADPQIVSVRLNGKPKDYDGEPSPEGD